MASIIICMYNEAPHIRKCLESILAQSFDMSQCEILVVDGRSTDRSADIVRDVARAHPNVRLIDNPERVQVAALNLGVRHARGRYVLQMDSHCRFHDDYIRQVVETFETTTAHNVVGVFHPRPGADTRMGRAIWRVQTSRVGAGASYGWRPGPPRFIGEHESITAGWSFRRDLFDKIGLFDTRLISNHDNDMSCRTYEAGLGVYFNPAVQAEYFSRAQLWPFFKTMYRNGRYLVPMWRIRPGTFALHHVAPMVFVAALLATGLGGALWRPLWLVFAAVFGAYALVIGAASAALAVKNGVYLLAYLPWIFLTTHLAYGLGTLVGIVRYGLGPLPGVSKSGNTATTENRPAAE